MKRMFGTLTVAVVAAIGAGIVVSHVTGRDKDERLEQAEADLAALKDTLAAVRDTAEQAMERAKQLEEEARQDSIDRVPIIREVERAIQVDLETAAATADTVRQVLEAAAPEFVPVFNRLLAAQAVALGRTQFLLDDERAEHDRTRGRVLTWQTAAFKAETRALVAERAQAAAERALAVAKERDVELPFGLGGVDVTCGPGVGLSWGTRGGDASVHVGCTAGR